MAFVIHSAHIQAERGKAGFREAWRSIAALPHIVALVFEMAAHPERYSLDDDC